MHFIQFDIESFYPSITAELFQKAVDFAKQHIAISDSDLNIIMQSRRTLLFHNSETWAKRTADDEFDVTMGAYDGAEVSELVGIFLLKEISWVVNSSDIGLYRDDGLGIMRRIGKPEVERRKKRIIHIFKQHNLKVTIAANLHTSQYLDVEFDLKNNAYRPYKKPNNETLYINKLSNHPPAVIKQVPKSVARRLSDISSSVDEFKNAVPAYENALQLSGYTEKLYYVEEENIDQGGRQQQRRRRRKIIWYNPPYASNVRTDIGRKFLNLLQQHFTRIIDCMLSSIRILLN